MNEHLEEILKEAWNTWQANARDQDEVETAIESVIKNAGEVRRQFEIGEVIRRQLQQENEQLRDEVERLRSKVA